MKKSGCERRLAAALTSLFSTIFSSFFFNSENFNFIFFIFYMHDANTLEYCLQLAVISFEKAGSSPYIFIFLFIYIYNLFIYLFIYFHHNCTHPSTPPTDRPPSWCSAPVLVAPSSAPASALRRATAPPRRGPDQEVNRVGGKKISESRGRMS